MIDAAQSKLSLGMHRTEASWGDRTKPGWLAPIIIAIALMTGGSALASASAPQAAAKADGAAAPNSDQGAKESPFGDFGSNQKRGPVNIQSDAMSLDYKNNKVLFSGRVHAVQADGQLTSDTLNVKYGKDFHDLQEMVADGTVRLSQGLRWCTSDHAVMNQAAHTLILTGSPVCHDANDEISGPTITVHTDTGKSDVNGGVKATIFPHDTKSDDNKKGTDDGE
jgi:lipopolysaccharide transport protein LptA